MPLSRWLWQLLWTVHPGRLRRAALCRRLRSGCGGRIGQRSRSPTAGLLRAAQRAAALRSGWLRQSLGSPRTAFGMLQQRLAAPAATLPAGWHHSRAVPPAQSACTLVGLSLHRHRRPARRRRVSGLASRQVHAPVKGAQRSAAAAPAACAPRRGSQSMRTARRCRSMATAWPLPAHRRLLPHLQVCRHLPPGHPLCPIGTARPLSAAAALGLHQQCFSAMDQMGSRAQSSRWEGCLIRLAATPAWSRPRGRARRR